MTLNKRILCAFLGFIMILLGVILASFVYRRMTAPQNVFDVVAEELRKVEYSGFDEGFLLQGRENSEWDYDLGSFVGVYIPAGDYQLVVYPGRRSTRSVVFFFYNLQDHHKNLTYEYVVKSRCLFAEGDPAFLWDNFLSDYLAWNEREYDDFPFSLQKPGSYGTIVAHPYTWDEYEEYC